MGRESNAAERRDQIVRALYDCLTEPLSDDLLQQIGWENRQGIEGARNLVLYYWLTADSRLLMGGRDAGLAWGNDMDKDQSPEIFDGLENLFTD